MSAKPLRVAVLLGGMSAEREVSLVSGAECVKAMTALGHQAIPIDVNENLGAILAKTRPDVVFNALHGRYGEDGTVQGLLEIMKLPYTHSGVLASALAMDKEKTKLAYRSVGLPVASSVLATRDEVSTRHIMEPPYVVKPFNEGSSVGVYIVAANANTPPQIAPDMPAILMVEKYLAGRELTVAVQGDRALGVTEIITKGWYDYDAKYKAGGSRHVFPADLPENITALCQDYALSAHQVLGCRGVSRTDLRWDETAGEAGLFLLETNTQPGMTPTSLAPEQAMHDGQSFAQFIQWMLDDASCLR